MRKYINARIAINSYPPFLTFINERKIEGFDFVLRANNFYESLKLNLSYVPINTWTYGYKQENGSYDGLGSYIQNNKIDFACVPSSIVIGGEPGIVSPVIRLEKKIQILLRTSLRLTTGPGSFLFQFLLR
ncbi:hypothetical protein B4U79_17875 [Dinothrombium tinctorium]|uniref:Uncharacterized protein n=2 Tax=Dinothrombium tinctorium TaxID=1965070 RepID=A0A3S4RHL0_9ACAR|nr:hypothetical protein B4U79_17875 [Dinothrombium tinctorium]